MCLTTVVTRYAEPTLDEVVAWKIVRCIADGRILTPCMGVKVVPNIWQEASSTYWEEVGYEAGWHAYVTREEAEGSWMRYEPYGRPNDRIVEVRLRQVTAVGTEETGEMVANVLVAREMFIEEAALAEI